MQRVTCRKALDGLDGETALVRIPVGELVSLSHLDLVALACLDAIALLHTVRHEVKDPARTVVGQHKIANVERLDRMPATGGGHQGALSEALSAALDGSGRRVGTPHEADGPRSGTAALQSFA